MKKKILRLILTDGSWVWKAATWILSGVFVGSIPYLIFVVYMLDNHFFSYDMFEKGVFGVKVFFWGVALTIVMIAYASWGWLFMAIHNIYLYKQHKKIECLLQLISMIFLGLMVSLYVITIKNDSEYVWVLSLSTGYGLFVMGHIYVLLTQKSIIKLLSLAGLAGATIYFSFVFKSPLSDITGLTLKQFGMGGEALVVIPDKEITIPYGNLILQTPENLYIKESNSVAIVTVQKNSISEFSIYVDGTEYRSINSGPITTESGVP